MATTLVHSHWWAGLSRVADPKITLASMASVFIGASAAARDGPISWPWLLLTVAGIFFIEAAKNASGEIFDWESGADLNVADEDRSPFSGGKRVLVEGLMTRGELGVLAALLYMLAAAVGFAIVALREPYVLWLGLAGAALAFFYHAPPLRLSYRGLGELTVALAYGPMICAGTYLVQRRALSADVIALALPLALLVAAFLWINEFPDARADAKAGKRTLVVRLGRRDASRIYPVIAGVAYLALLALPLLGTTRWVWLGLAGAPLSAAAAHRLWFDYGDTQRVVAAQGWTLIAFVTAAVGVGIGLLVG
ncbi:MAG: prenyltransferase [Myxococcales bacterium]|nr:prenyltransferase [Myxococcales bacterium]